jgi:hypothetical protein
MQLSGLELQGGTGNPTRVTMFGTSGADFARAVRATSDGSVYVTGSTTGALYAPLAGGWDAWASKLTGTTPAWPGGGVQFGSSGDDHGSDIATDLFGNGFVTGDTTGALGAGVAQSFGGLDRFVAKLGPHGHCSSIRFQHEPEKQRGSGSRGPCDGQRSSDLLLRRAIGGASRSCVRAGRKLE